MEQIFLKGAYMSDYFEWISNTVLDLTFLRPVIIVIIIVFAVWLIRRLVVRIAMERLDDVMVRYQFQKISGYIAVAAVFILLSPLLVGGFQNAATYFGLLSAGIAIALQELISDFAGWVFIIWRRPFKIGDRIQVGDVAGDVVDLRIFQFSLIEIGNWVDADQSTGRIVHVPNGHVFTQALSNYSSGFQFIWNEIPVLITFESNWKKAKKILHDIADQHGIELTKSAEKQIQEASKQFLIFYSTLTPTVYTNVKDSGVLLTIRYICEPRKRRGSAQKMWEAILESFSEHDDIDLAYPTIRYYNNTTEGKSGTQPQALP
jgi:small-conductance mechanosensitive channel